MSKRNDWGLPLNSTIRTAQLADAADMSVRNEEIFKDGKGGTPTSLFLYDTLIRELAGKYYFETKNEDLIRQENTFWWNLIWEGKIGILNYQNRPMVVRINNVTLNGFKEVVKVGIQKASIAFAFGASQNPKDENKVVYVDPKRVAILWLDTSSTPFLIRYKPMVDRMKKIYAQKLQADTIKNKVAALHVNTKKEGLTNDFLDGFNNGETIDIIKSPKIESNMEDPMSALEKPFIFQDYAFDKSFLISMEDLMKQWKFDKDLVGMEENSSEKKERVQSMEIEDNRSNTVQMKEVEIKNQNSFLQDFKKIFPEIQLEIKCTVDEKLQVEESEFAYNDNEGDNNGEQTV